jgi:hypothetical protein
MWIAKELKIGKDVARIIGKIVFESRKIQPEVWYVEWKKVMKKN